MTAEEIIRALDLTPHPEGGFFREVYRSPARVQHPEVPGPVGLRSAMTSISFLLRRGDFSAWHRVRSDEVWNLHAGGPMELHLLSPAGEHSRHLLGTDFSRGQQAQRVVPAGWWQAARPVQDAEFALCGCVVVPGFDFADFELAASAELQRRFPAFSALIHEFTR